MLKICLVLLSLAGQEEQAASRGSIDVFPNCATVDGNLVKNCGFESPTDFEFWSLSGDTSFMQVTSDARHSGNRGASLGPVNFNGFLSQTLSTVPGQSYDVSFWLHNNALPNQFVFYWDGTLVSSNNNFPSTPNALERNFDQTLYANLPASGEQTIISFGFFNPPDFFFFDDVVVTPSAAGLKSN